MNIDQVHCGTASAVRTGLHRQHRRACCGWPGLLCLAALVMALTGCLPAANSNASYLLGQDYHRMTDAQLVAYEQDLSDELVQSSRSGGGDVNLGFGFGGWSGNTGYGVHADKWLGGGSGNSASFDLQVRRDEVRAEMKRRGLLPQ